MSLKDAITVGLPKYLASLPVPEDMDGLKALDADKVRLLATPPKPNPLNRKQRGCGDCSPPLSAASGESPPPPLGLPPSPFDSMRAPCSLRVSFSYACGFHAVSSTQPTVSRCSVAVLSLPSERTEHANTHMRSHTHPHTPAPAHTRTRTRTRTRTPTLSHTRACTALHTRMRTHMRARGR